MVSDIHNITVDHMFFGDLWLEANVNIKLIPEFQCKVSAEHAKKIPNPNFSLKVPVFVNNWKVKIDPPALAEIKFGEVNHRHPDNQISQSSIKFLKKFSLDNVPVVQGTVKLGK
eukprot:Pgem_evm1s12646